MQKATELKLIEGLISDNQITAEDYPLISAKFRRRGCGSSSLFKPIYKNLVRS